MVYDALESTRNSVNFCDDFYTQAIKGSKILGIEQYDGGRADLLNSMLYQGGLPMNLVTQNETNSVWNRFTRGLINKRINFDELNLGLVATQSQSLKDYCDQLIVAIESEQHMLMPFYCHDEYNKWFFSLIALSKQEKKRQRQLHPFSLDWELRVDTIEKQIYPKYIVKGSQKLPLAFLEEEGLKGNPFFSVLVKINGKAADTFDYLNGFCRYTVESKHPYKLGDNVSLTIQDNEEPHISGSLDVSIPHIFYKDMDGMYKLGNHIGTEQSLLLIPDDWQVENKGNYTIEIFKWDNVEFRGIIISPEFKEEIIVSSQDGEITFGANAPMYWTELSSNPIYIPDFEEALYNAANTKFKLCFDTEDGVKTLNNTNIQYRSKWQDKWSDNPSYGEIYARAKDPNNHFVTPIKIINIGEAPIINLQKADKETCEIRVSWRLGRVTTNEGVKRIDDVWHIKKEDCSNKNRIQFTFIPNDNSRNQFTLSLRAPFKAFAILDINGNTISSDVWIPYTDLDKYQYHLIGQNIKYTYGQHIRELNWIRNKLFIIENGEKPKSITYEGSLLTLFDSRESVRALLDKTSQNMINAQLSVSFVTSNHERINIDIKDSPFRPKQTKDGKIVVTGKFEQPIEFNGVFKLLKLDEPSMDPEILSYHKENGYVLPETIRSWGKTILIGRTRGRICPTLVDLSCDIDIVNRHDTREIAIATIKENLEKSDLGDSLWQRVIGWFDKIQEEDIPASSLLELYCVAQNPKHLICLAFQLFVRCFDEEVQDVLSDQLKSFSNDLAFQWYWLLPQAIGLKDIINRFVGNTDNEVVNKIYIQWALTQGTNTSNYLRAIGEDRFQYLIEAFSDTISKFDLWMKHLYLKSLVDSYGVKPKEFIESIAKTIIFESGETYRIDSDSYIYIETNQEFISESMDQFFTNYKEQNLNGNEQWLHTRINAVIANLRNEIDLFSQAEEIKRSIIFCAKSCNDQFIIGLYNKLAR